MGISPAPLVFERAEGPYLFDADGNPLVDYYLGMGPMILGHSPEPVRRAVARQLEDGILFGGQSRLEAAVDGSVLAEVGERGQRLMQGIDAALAEAGVTASVTGFGQIFHVAFGLSEPARDYRDLMRMDRPRYVRFCEALLSRRVRVLERGAWFLSSAHDDEALDETLRAVREAARDV